MRTTALTKEEKSELERLLQKLRILPPVAGQVLLNIDGNGKVASAELSRVVWR